MKNKQVKQMICDAVINSCNGNCGSVYWESTKDLCVTGYPNQILIVDGMYGIEHSFWYTPHKASLTANQLKSN